MATSTLSANPTPHLPVTSPCHHRLTPCRPISPPGSSIPSPTTATAVFLGAPDTNTLTHLAAETQLHIIVVEHASSRVQILRNELVPTGLYGSRIAVNHADPNSYQLPPYFADFVFVTSTTQLDSRDRVFQSVRPYGGKLITQTPSGLKTTHTRRRTTR